MRSGVWRDRPQRRQRNRCSAPPLQSYPNSAIESLHTLLRQGDVVTACWCSFVPISGTREPPSKLVPCARQSVRLLVVIATRAADMSLVLDMAETERSGAVSGCKMDKVDEMRMQSRGWACADAAESSRVCWAADCIYGVFQRQRRHACIEAREKDYGEGTNGEQPSRTRTLPETSWANKVQRSDTCSMHEVERGTIMTTLPVRCNLLWLVSPRCCLLILV